MRARAGLPTPCALVDLAVLERNASRMAERMRRLGVRLRPHVKTHKCVEAARIQTRGQAGGITVSTLAEARAFAAAGFRDVLHAFPFPPPRAEEAADLARRVDRLTLLVDQEETVPVLDRAARRAGVRLPVLVEVDCGDRRSGVDPAGEEGLRVARAVADAPGLALAGVLTHAGQAYRAKRPDEVRAVARRERDVAVGLAERLRAAGLDAGEVSVGSTPTMTHAEDLTGVTEARPGNYLLLDVFQAAIGSGTLGDVALTVLATVVGRYPRRGEIVIDAGALALSKDPGPVHVDPACGFGVVADEEDGTIHEDVRVVSLSQEHGVVRAGAKLALFPVGSRVRILPNHACLTVACFEALHVTRGGEVVDAWRPARGW